MKLLLAMLALASTLSSCAPKPGTPLGRTGDEIMVCGRLFHTGTRVVLWTDLGGYDGYRVEKRFAPLEPLTNRPASAPATAPVEIPGARFGLRKDTLTPEEIERVRGGGWDLPLLCRVVDQFVIHYDAVGDSRGCFEVLHDKRGLSVHFLLDTDGTIYQTLDLKERAWHATTSNNRSIGIEIAHTGTIRANDPRVTSSMIRGTIQGQDLAQAPFTEAQYRALVKLTAALCAVFPELKCDYPRDSAGDLVRRKLDDETLKNYKGLLGHYHIQTNKVDPGPAFDWDRVVREARDAR